MARTHIEGTVLISRMGAGRRPCSDLWAGKVSPVVTFEAATDTGPHFADSGRRHCAAHDAATTKEPALFLEPGAAERQPAPRSSQTRQTTLTVTFRNVAGIDVAPGFTEAF